MKAYHLITVISHAAGSYDENDDWQPGTATESQVLGASAPAELTRNRNEEGANTTDAFDFWLFTDSWDPHNIIVENGVRYTTQTFRRWNVYGAWEGVAVRGLAEVP